MPYHDAGLDFDIEARFYNMLICHWNDLLDSINVNDICRLATTVAKTSNTTIYNFRVMTSLPTRMLTTVGAGCIEPRDYQVLTIYADRRMSTA